VQLDSDFNMVDKEKDYSAVYSRDLMFLNSKFEFLSSEIDKLTNKFKDRGLSEDIICKEFGYFKSELKETMFSIESIILVHSKSYNSSPEINKREDDSLRPPSPCLIENNTTVVPFKEKAGETFLLRPLKEVLSLCPAIGGKIRDLSMTFISVVIFLSGVLIWLMWKDEHNQFIFTSDFVDNSTKHIMSSALCVTIVLASEYSGQITHLFRKPINSHILNLICLMEFLSLQ